MKKINLLAIIILISILLFSGCAKQVSKAENALPENISNSVYEADLDKLATDKLLAEKLAAEKQAILLQERAELEKARKAELGEFYLPLPPLGQDPALHKVKAKALYVTANVAGMSFQEADIRYYADYIRAKSGQSGQPADSSRLGEINKLEKVLGICTSTEINALVIDVKNDDGLVAWNSDIPIVNQIKANWSKPLKNHAKLMAYLKNNQIYTIGRVVAFKDPYFAKTMSGHAIQLKAGGVYKDDAGRAWVNPFDQYVWKYLIAISREAALRGFQEIQFDYVRFPDNARYYNPITTFPGRDGRDKDEGIEDFLAYAREELAPYHVHLSADVFGVITHSWDDKPDDIGQTWRKIAGQVDYICPMIYPSHYGAGVYGFPVPDQHPYEVARLALIEALERNAAQKTPGMIRPWFQGFNAPWVRGHIDYNPKTISAQIVASRELGIKEYIIWNAANNYDPMIFFYQPRMDKNIRKSGEDTLARTPAITMEKYLKAEKSQQYSQLYLLTPQSARPEEYDQFVMETKKSQLTLKNYQLLQTAKNGDGSYTAKVNGEYLSSKGTAVMKAAEFKIILENDVYKVIKPELVWQAK